MILAAPDDGDNQDAPPSCSTTSRSCRLLITHAQQQRCAVAHRPLRARRRLHHHRNNNQSRPFRHISTHHLAGCEPRGVHDERREGHPRCDDEPALRPEGRHGLPQAVLEAQGEAQAEPHARGEQRRLQEGDDGRLQCKEGERRGEVVQPERLRSHGQHPPSLGACGGRRAAGGGAGGTRQHRQICSKYSLAVPTPEGRAGILPAYPLLLYTDIRGYPHRGCPCSARATRATRRASTRTTAPRKSALRHHHRHRRHYRSHPRCPRTPPRTQTCPRRRG